MVPLVLIASVYLVVRFAVTPLPSTAGGMPAYSPQLSTDVAARKLLLLTATVGNLSFVDRHVVGQAGLSRWASSALVGSDAWEAAIEGAQYAVLLALLLATLWSGRTAGRLLLIPAAIIAGFYSAPMLTRTLGMHYFNEPMAGVAILLALCLDRAGARMAGAWAVALVAIGLNGAISNHTSLVFWQHSADRAGAVIAAVRRADHGQPLEEITFLARPDSPTTMENWQGLLMVGGTGPQGNSPLIPELIGRPHLRISFTESAGLRARLADAGPAHLFFDLIGYDTDGQVLLLDPAAPPPPSVLVRILPAETYAGAGVNVQPDGSSAIALQMEGAPSEGVVWMDGTRLATATNSPGWFSAAVPPDLLVRAGRRDVYVADRYGESNRLPFVVEVPRPPVLRAIHPPAARAGAGVNVQPDGRSVIAVFAQDVWPDTVAVMGGRRLQTSYTNRELLSAIVPDDLLTDPGVREVYLANGAGESNRVGFPVEP